MSATSKSITLHRHALSGHSHKAELFLSLLGVQANIVDVDLKSGAHKQKEFLEKNAFGQVPVLEDGETAVADSNAILVYLAAKYDIGRRWLPTQVVDLAEVQRFLSVAAGALVAGPATARLVNVFSAKRDHSKAIEMAHNIFAVFEAHLADREWLVSKHPTIADIANYTYTAHAPEGDISLETYPNIRAWLQRIENLNGFVPMQRTKVGCSA